MEVSICFSTSLLAGLALHPFGFFLAVSFSDRTFAVGRETQCYLSLGL